MKILITGANGFVGKSVANQLKSDNVEVNSLVRANHETSNQSNIVTIENFHDENEWLSVLNDVDVVIHLIARTHNTSENDQESLSLYKETNVGITETLCDAILKSSVKRLVFLSSIKVNGEETYGKPFNELSEEKPEDNYGLTKQEAENIIKKKFHNSSKEYVIVRPPLIYGRELKGNLETLQKIIAKGIPLPFKSVKNSRSLISLDLLSNFLSFCAKNEAVANQIFLVSDDRNYSISEIISRIAYDHHLKDRQISIPPILLKILLRLSGKRNMERKLFSNLEVNSNKIKQLMQIPDNI